MSKKILITGAAGFIGYHLCKSLLEDEIEVLGIDNLINYYDPVLKQSRLELLRSHPNFNFEKIDISQREKLTEVFTRFRPNKVVNLAAQAGVRYSLKNPYAYMESNLVGFLNIIELCRQNDVEGLIYASSSSVYGSNKKIPFGVEDRVDYPLSLYAATKRANELIAHSYSHLYGLHTTGLRFFTVYGPWGRPDMAMFIFTKQILAGKSINLFNDGKMQRDFTFVNDIINGTRAAIRLNANCEIFNLGNNRSEQLLDVVDNLERYLEKKAIINYLPMQPGDIEKSHADIEYSKERLGYNPTTNIKDGILLFTQWYKSYHGID